MWIQKDVGHLPEYRKLFAERGLKTELVMWEAPLGEIKKNNRIDSPKSEEDQRIIFVYPLEDKAPSPAPLLPKKGEKSGK